MVMLRKADVLAFAGSGSVQTEGYRVLFENHEVRVEHATRTFPTTPHLKQFSHSTVSKMVKSPTETGAISLSDDSTLIISDV